MVIAWVFVQDGCSACLDLEGWVRDARLTTKVEFSGNNPCGSGTTPATKTAAGCFTYEKGCNNACQLEAIKAAASTAKAATPAAPATTTKTAPTAATETPEWKTAQWSNSIVVNWGERNPKPVIAETPAGWQPPDVQLTPVLPLPPTITTGICIALRDHKRVPKGRKIA